MKLTLSRARWLALANCCALCIALIALVVVLRPEHAASDAQNDGAAGGVQLTRHHASVEDVLNAPLFNRTRSPVAVADSPNAQAPAPVLEPPILLGVIGENGKFRALFEDAQTNVRKLVRENETFNGWTVVLIGPKKVELKAGAREVLLDLSIPRPIPINSNPQQNQVKQ